MAASVSSTPEDLLYAESHEWIRIEGREATIGITDHAQNALNDIVYVELPQVDDSLDQGQEFGVVESVKSASDVYMPVGGRIIEVNSSLEDAPERVNEDPYGEGWLIRIEIADEGEAETLLSASAYKATLEE